MNDRQDEVLYEHHEPVREGRGCLFWGCLITAIIFLLLVVGIPLAGYFTFRHYVNKFTSDQPVEIAVVELPEEELAELTQRFESFSEAVKAGDTPNDLNLSAEEINALISQNPDLKGRAVVRIADGQIGGDVSIPLDKVPGAGGRYLNATVDFDVSLEEGELVVTLVSGEVNGTAIPQQAIDVLKSENLVEKNYENADFRKMLRKFESLEVTSDRIILKAKPETNPVAAEVETAEELEALEPAAQ